MKLKAKAFIKQGGAGARFKKSEGSKALQWAKEQAELDNLIRYYLDGEEIILLAGKDESEIEAISNGMGLDFERVKPAFAETIHRFFRESSKMQLNLEHQGVRIEEAGRAFFIEQSGETVCIEPNSEQDALILSGMFSALANRLRIWTKK
jgi:hypothetical protein